MLWPKRTPNLIEAADYFEEPSPTVIDASMPSLTLTWVQVHDQVLTKLWPLRY
jgi:hypothetical protein